MAKPKKKPGPSKGSKYKQGAIEARRTKVLTMYLYGFTQPEMARYCGCSLRTVAKDVRWAKKEIGEREVPFGQLRNWLTFMLMQLIKEMKLIEMGTKNRKTKFSMLLKMTKVILRMWMKLIPKGSVLEGLMNAPPPTEEESRKAEEEMENNAEGADSERNG